ncbi:fungal specific transcription factor, putative [Talaromyces stipitatus ATCC 10500]|uniref:Fungal specific transcription factor, putative n=1 Tax=Talaromyces stipitatus (strain ATCC 10500 / CBS 375.48 / QM 6759 / NRRL 1006) TaxID=441959 RepID=B8MAG3_TALSN|nr:fungal specific transcription factor, putative [Talaromyces stipitatus ATCC 10500]EED18665.1 fungal specific transcription factor, putative [Talaromyces stipitatus ATCC 10500]
MLPPMPYLSQLLSFYSDEIHLILPLIDINFFQRDIDGRLKILLSQAMCLLASMSPHCKSLLYLPGENKLLAPRLFGYRIFCAMRCEIELGAVTNRLVLIQALGALTLFIEGPEGPETASQLCAKMIQLVQTLGLHIQRGSDHEEDYEVTCLCCAWALDRLNAAIHGRSVLMHERDIARDLNKCFENQKPAFRLLLAVISQLDQVIDLYRPHSRSKGADLKSHYPQFDDIVVSAQCTNLHAKLLSTVEVLYYAVAILSCRSTERPSNNDFRQIYAASKINSIVEQDIRNQKRLLVFLPFIPYAVSLSLSISYNQMRYTRVAMYRTRAREELQFTCGLLEQLGTHFYVASAMASMGKATIAEIDRVSENMLREKNPDGRSHNNQRPTESSSRNDRPAAVNTSDGAIELDPSNSGLSSTVNEFSVSDIDVFDMFDPNFGLDNIDAVFRSNLDLSTPMYLPFYTGDIDSF